MLWRRNRPFCSRSLRAKIGYARRSQFCSEVAEGASARDRREIGRSAPFSDVRSAVYPQFDPQSRTEFRRMFPNGGDRGPPRSAPEPAIVSRCRTSSGPLRLRLAAQRDCWLLCPTVIGGRRRRIAQNSPSRTGGYCEGAVVAGRESCCIALPVNPLCNDNCDVRSATIRMAGFAASRRWA